MPLVCTPVENSTFLWSGLTILFALVSYQPAIWISVPRDHQEDHVLYSSWLSEKLASAAIRWVCQWCGIYKNSAIPQCSFTVNISLKVVGQKQPPWLGFRAAQPMLWFRYGWGLPPCVLKAYPWVVMLGDGGPL